MPISVKLSSHAEAIRSRFRRLPQHYAVAIEAAIKKDALETLATFKAGISQNILNLTPLASSTVERKSQLGYRKPKTPLYGRGEADSKSYINSLEVRKVGTTFILGPREGSHWSGLPFKVIFQLHERGATITTKSGGVIRIRPRPALSRAFRRHLRKKSTRDPAKRIKRAITLFINTGSLKEVRLMELDAVKNAKSIHPRIKNV